MAKITQDIIDLVNDRKRVGVVCTVNPNGEPNVAYFGSPRFRDKKSISMGLTGGRTLENLKTNPNAVFFCVEPGPVTFTTPAVRLYLRVKSIETGGDLLKQIKTEVSERVNPDVAAMISSAISFEITEIRRLVD